MGALKPWHVLLLLVCMAVVVAAITVSVFVATRRRK
jgi:hypothetical protein